MVSWDTDRSRDGGIAGAVRIEVVPVDDSETVTFVSNRPEDRETTTAWITAEADVVVDVSTMQ
jgi:hypothetical protein